MINELVASQAIAPVKDDVSPVHVGARYEQSRGTGDVELVEARVPGSIQRWSQAPLWEVDEAAGGADGDTGPEAERGPRPCLLPAPLKLCSKHGTPMKARVTSDVSHGKRIWRLKYVCAACGRESQHKHRRGRMTPEQAAACDERMALIEANRQLSPEELVRKNSRLWHERTRARQLERRGWTPRIRQKYGLSLEAYIELLEKQDYKCPMCGKPHRYEEWASKPAAVGAGTMSGEDHVKHYLLHVDHDHETGEVRGLLCSDCNILEGHVRRALSRGVNLQNLVDYTQQHERREEHRDVA